MGLAYGACSEPSEGCAQRIAVVIDPQGKVQEYHESVDAKQFPAEVCARL